MKLTTKLIGSIAVGSILSIGLISIISYSLTRDALNSEIVAEQLESAQQTLDKIDRLLYERQNSISVIADNAGALIQYVNETRAIDKSSQLTLLGQQVIERLKPATGPWDSVGVLGPDGRVLYSTNTNLPPALANVSANPTVVPYFKQALAGQVVFSDVYISPATQRPTMAFMAPVRDIASPSRPVIGVVAASLSWSVVLEILQADSSTTTTLLTKNAVVIGDNHPNDDNQILKKGRPIDAGLTKALAGSDQSATQTNSQGLQLLTSYAHEKGFSSFPGNGWVLVMETPTTTAFAPALHTAVTTVLVLLVIIVVVSGAVVLLVFRSLRPLALIDATAHEIAHGDFTKRVTYKSRDEIGRLSSSFNVMADKLERSHDELEQKITQRTEQIARQTQDLQKFQSAVENASDLVVITDARGNIIYANPQLEPMTGWQREEVLGKTPGALWAGKADRAIYSHLWESIRGDKRTTTAEITNVRRDGQLYYVKNSLSPILNERGDIAFFVLIEHDVTKDRQERQRTEKVVRERTSELVKERARLEASLSNLKVGLLMTDARDNVIFMNQAVRAMLPAIRQGLTIKDLQRSLREAGLDFDIQKELTAAQQSGRVSEISELQLHGKYYHTYASPIRSGVRAANKPIGGVLLMEDITEEKVLQRSRDEFFSIASHELRTPLTAIRGNMSMLRDFFSDKLKNEQAQEMMADVIESCSRLINIVNDFLDMSRLEQGRISYVNSAFDAVKLCQGVMKELDVTGSRQGISLSVTRPRSLPPLVYADQNRVRQIIVNLVGNALKFTKEGGVTISFSTEPRLVKVYVADTGKGISPENQALLFRKFQQAQNDILTRDTTQGAGLGLYISRLMAREMGGEVVIEHSEEGKGSTFSLSIPIASTTQKKAAR